MLTSCGHSSYVIKWWLLLLSPWLYLELRPMPLVMSLRVLLMGLQKIGRSQYKSGPDYKKRAWKEEDFGILSAFLHSHWEVHLSHYWSITLLALEMISLGWQCSWKSRNSIRILWNSTIQSGLLIIVWIITIFLEFCLWDSHNWAKKRKSKSL